MKRRNGNKILDHGNLARKLLLLYILPAVKAFLFQNSKLSVFFDNHPVNWYLNLLALSHDTRKSKDEREKNKKKRKQRGEERGRIPSTASLFPLFDICVAEPSPNWRHPYVCTIEAPFELGWRPWQQQARVATPSSLLTSLPRFGYTLQRPKLPPLVLIWESKRCYLRVQQTGRTFNVIVGGEDFFYSPSFLPAVPNSNIGRYYFAIF